MEAKSSPEDPVSDVIAWVTVKQRPSTAPAGFSAEASRQASAGRIRSASRSRISTRTARSPHTPEPGVRQGGARGERAGEPLQDIDAHGALAAHAVAGRAVERLRGFLVGREGGAAARRQPLHLVEALGFPARDA